MKMSYVTLDRFVREHAARDDSIRRKLEADNRPVRSSADQMTDGELLTKLGSLGFDLDRRGVEELCEGALSVEDVARPLVDEWEARNPVGGFDMDWIWICLLALWERWWPDQACMELLDDKMQTGYDHQERNDVAACATTWLAAWADILHLCDATGIRSIDEFDETFPLTQSLFNWIGDIEMELWNAGIGNREFLTARIDFCTEAMRRFPGEDQLLAENLRRGLAETWFEIGESARADELFESWLTADPQWGWGWIGWSGCYQGSFKAPPKEPVRAEELLRRGYAIPGVRDRADIADRVTLLCEENGRPSEAREWESMTRQLRNPAVLSLSAGRQQAGGKVGRNAPCPCGSGQKYKKCCGSPLLRP
jgi:hypothetical protein